VALPRWPFGDCHGLTHPVAVIASGMADDVGSSRNKKCKDIFKMHASFIDHEAVLARPVPVNLTGRGLIEVASQK